MLEWTMEQLAAITAQGNLIVSAAAGAGKTAVLTERLCRIVADGTPVDRLLVLTFTRAAAAEMKHRIGSRLAELGEKEKDPAKARYFRQQQEAIDRAYITTIDAFCSRVLSRHGHLIGLSPDVRVADETELAAIADGVRDTLLTLLALEKNADLTLLIRAFGSERAMLEAMDALLDFLSAQPDPDGWMARARTRAADPAYAQRLLREAVSEAKDEIRERVGALCRARGCTDDANVLRVLDEDLSQLRALLLLTEYDEYRDALAGFSFDTLRFARGTREEEKDPVRLPREEMKESVKRQREQFSHTGAEECARQARAVPVLSALFELAARFRTAFSDAKRESCVIDFADMEHMALALLSIESVAEEYRERFLHIAVDEYQDSNRLQEALLIKLRRPDNLFLVGDVKQSIYRFRGAEPGLFLEKLALAEKGRMGRVDLSANFRSDEAILRSVNGTFEKLMTRETAGLNYDARARLVAGKEPSGGSAALHLLERRTGANADALLEEAADTEIEARLAAEQIKQLMASPGLPDARTGALRKYRYEDFAILLRTNTDAVSYARQLSLLGIPCYAQATGGYFDALEVMLLLHILRAVDNRRFDVPLLSAATSAAGGFTFEELAGMRARHRGGGIYDCIAETAAEEQAESGKARAFLARLDRWRAESRLVSVEKLIARILEETGFFEEMGALPGGAERQANITALLEQAHAYEKTGARSLYGFLAYMEKAQKTASVGASQTANADVVRILSMHKSKGLEYPVVFLCQLGKRFNKRDSREALQLHANLGAGVRFIDKDTGQRTDTIARKRLSAQAANEAVAEELRVLYVAMTRARSRLVLIGTLPNAVDTAERLRSRTPSAFSVRRAATPMHLLLMANAVPRHLHVRSGWLRPVQEAVRPPLPPPDPVLTEAIRTRFSWRYPFAADGALPARAAVSRLNDPGQDVYSMPEFAVPAFLADGHASASARGTATHLLLQHLPYETMAPADVRALAGALAAAGRMTQAQAEAVYFREVAAFTHSPLFARMIKSPRVERELPFSAMVPASRVFAAGGAETVLLQGVIDCCFLEDGAWVVVDYKTDRVPPDGSAAEVAAKHALQVGLYAETLERLTGIPVRERIVCLILAGVAVPIPATGTPREP